MDNQNALIARNPVSHYLPRLQREFYQADAVVFWTLPVQNRQTGWLTPQFHHHFREMMLHAAAREGLISPAYCLMPDHLHLVWMGLRNSSDQRNAMKFLRAHLGPSLKPARFQHQAHDHVLGPAERRRSRFTLACTDYVLLDPLRAGLVKDPAEWPYAGAILPGYPPVKSLRIGILGQILGALCHGERTRTGKENPPAASNRINKCAELTSAATKMV